ncbi:MAG TPA: peptidoglycan DD-metalloendopeptidase family protein [Vicinamibacterales bacterium]|nr:peptidoglycan DD-metalloendopeptidase family protein [Vicinamibacterales bacterium]
MIDAVRAGESRQSRNISPALIALSRLRRRRGLYVAAASIAIAISVQAQSDPKSLADRAAARIAALQQESDRLAEQARTVFGDLRRLEIDRQIKQEQLVKAQADLKRITLARDNAADHVATLEAIRIAQTPGVKERLVELSKRGRGGYVQLLLASDDVRSVGRLARGVAAVAELDRVRLETHRRAIAAERAALAELQQQHAALARAQRDAAAARAGIEAAVAARNRRLAELDERRDLAAQYVEELQQAHLQLERTIANSGTESAAARLPIRPFQGDLPWPVNGPVTSRFGRVAADRFGTTIVRNGIEVGATEGTPVAAVHEGRVAFAAPFAGFGTLVIIDHGSSAFTLYGHLLEAGVTAGTTVGRGSVIGRVGVAPTGTAALYFEVRIDGRPVNPLEWLKGSR